MPTRFHQTNQPNSTTGAGVGARSSQSKRQASSRVAYTRPLPGALRVSASPQHTARWRRGSYWQCRRWAARRSCPCSTTGGHWCNSSATAARRRTMASRADPRADHWCVVAHSRASGGAFACSKPAAASAALAAARCHAQSAAATAALIVGILLCMDVVCAVGSSCAIMLVHM
jgi:hypothetical protein